MNHIVSALCAVASGKAADKISEYVKRAMEQPVKAVMAGFKDTTNIKKNTDLGSLRACDDFKKLLVKLESMSPLQQDLPPP